MAKLRFSRRRRFGDISFDLAECRGHFGEILFQNFGQSTLIFRENYRRISAKFTFSTVLYRNSQCFLGVIQTVIRTTKGTTLETAYYFFATRL